MRTGGAIVVAMMMAGCGAAHGEDAALPSDFSMARDMATAGPTTVMVSVGGESFTFNPKDVTIKVGDTVKWTWAGSGHSVTSGTSGTADNKFCSPMDMNCAAGTTSNQGVTYSHTFNAAGSFPYYCAAHFANGMTGSVTVTTR